MNPQPTAATAPGHEGVRISHGRTWIDQSAGVRIGYTLAEPSSPPEKKASKTVVLLHGAPQTRHAWRHVLAPLARAGYRVIAPDYRGAGASSKPRDGYDKWTMAGDVHTLVHGELGVQGPVSVVGHDLGSMLAFAYALRHRDDVVSLTTMEAPLPGTDYYEQRKVAKSAWHFDFHANPDIAVYLTHGRERWYITRFFDDLTYQPDAITDADVDVYARAFQAPGAMRALCEIYRELDHDAQIHRDALTADGKLTVPVLASGGATQALAANYQAMCEEIADDVTGHLVEGTGHWVPEENPDGFVRMFRDFDDRARTA
ncbi:alpha/beta fold hydrolase [Streptomyces flaveolus]|uniref:alpha/beta fold hydrolase n=1 Tax=Streptomyces flaveolus TaxID=67297 RepID=UPI00340EB22A